MSVGIDKEFVRETYRGMTDQELIRVVTQDAAGLTPEALEVVKDEIANRNLDPSIVRGLEAQNKTYSVEEIDEYCELIRNLPCPITGATDKKLNATMTGEVMSFIFFTHFKKKIIVGRSNGLQQKSTAPFVTSLLLGWWGFPWGPIYTIKAIILYLKNLKLLNQETPNEYLRSFVLSKIGEIETYKNDRQRLQQLISE